MYRVKIYDLASSVLVADLAPIQLRVERQQNATGSYSFQVPIFMPDARKLENHARAYITEDGAVIMDGTIGKVSWAMSGDKVVYNVTGNAELADLANIRPHADSHYQNTSVTAILVDLLTSASGWALGDISTMLDPAKSTTLDLRDEKRLFPQIVKVVDSIPGNYYRYGGTDALGNRLIDIGAFGGDASHQLLQLATTPYDPLDWNDKVGVIGSVAINEDRNDIWNELESYGGTISKEDGSDYVISLADALAANPALATDPDFPIVLVGTVYVVRNTALWPSIGGGLREVYDEHVPDDEDAEPSTAEIEQAGLALYAKTVAELMDHADSVRTYAAEVLKMDDMPNVGNTVHIHATSVEAVFEGAFGETQVIPGFSLNDELRLVGWTLEVNEDGVQRSLEITEGDQVIVEDVFVQLYDALKPQPRKKRRGVGTTLQSAIVTVTQAVGPGLAPDTTLVINGNDAITVTIPTPSAPAWATSVARLGQPTAIPGGTTVEVLTEPSLSPATDLIVALDYAGGDWTVLSEAIVTATFIFSA